MSLRNRFCIFLVLVLTGCILIVGEYEYKPKSMDEVPAIMQFSFNLDEPLSVNIHQVHGKYLVRFAGKVSKAIQNNEIKLSPGKTDLVLLYP